MDGRRLYIDDGWEKDMGDLLFFYSAQGGDVLFFIIRIVFDFSGSCVIVAQVFGLSVCCV